MSNSKTKLQLITLLVYLVLGNPVLVAQTVDFKVDYKSFLFKHDMLWDIIPKNWETAPYTGNGNIGFLFYQTTSEGNNIMSVYVGRHDYYDHREAKSKEQQMLWINRSRLPLGHFDLQSKGNITAVNMRLNLWDAELTGTIFTTDGSYKIKGFTHSEKDILYFETDATKTESVRITWHPEKPIPPVYEELKKGQGPKGDSWDQMRATELEMPSNPVFSTAENYNFCYQPLFNNRGETTTGWQIIGKADGKQQLIASVHHSYPEHNSLAIVTKNLKEADKLIRGNRLFSIHQQWWHNYYPLSFLTINDAEKESFYWIQMYKLASATRGNGPIMDVIGPWYSKTFWPMVWGDLNVELIYWTHLTANRMSVGESLPNTIDKFSKNLEENVPLTWKNSAAIAALFPPDLEAYNGAAVPDMLVWILNNYWLHCKFAGDDVRMRDKLFPILKKTVNSYLNYIKENPVTSTDNKIHIKESWSPEYPGGFGQDINFTLSLIRWSCKTLIDINNQHHLNDPLLKEWQNLVTNLVDFQTDDNGLRIGKDIPFSKPHRHYSHLLGFYPLAVITPEKEENKKLLRTSLDHWLNVTINSGIVVDEMPITAYTATGASSMYACLGDGEKALYYLDFLIKHKNITPTTMYAEGGNPVIESPLSFATSLHDMLLQSWGGKIRVFPACPKKWEEVAFHDLRTQGAFLVSAKKMKGKTEFVAIQSLKGNECKVKTDLTTPNFYIQRKQIHPKVGEDGFYAINLKKGETVILTSKLLKDTDLKIEELPKSNGEKNLFGFSDKTKRLPGHLFYSNFNN